MMGYYGAGMAGWLWIVNALVTIVFWGGLIALGVWLFGRVTGERVRGDSAEEILKRRLAAGEITPEEFERLRKTLRT
jgi:putative membrane protein